MLMARKQSQWVTRERCGFRTRSFCNVEIFTGVPVQLFHDLVCQRQRWIAGRRGRPKPIALEGRELPAGCERAGGEAVDRVVEDLAGGGRGRRLPRRRRRRRRRVVGAGGGEVCLGPGINHDVGTASANLTTAGQGKQPKLCSACLPVRGGAAWRWEASPRVAPEKSPPKLRARWRSSPACQINMGRDPSAVRTQNHPTQGDLPTPRIGHRARTRLKRGKGGADAQRCSARRPCSPRVRDRA